MGKSNSINQSVLLGALAVLLYVSPGAWGEDVTAGVNVLIGFKTAVKKIECVKSLWISSLLDYGKEQDTLSCLRNDTRGDIADILDFVDQTTSADPTAKKLCTNLQKVVNCYVPDKEACKVVANNAKTYYTDSTCSMPGGNYTDVKAIKEFGDDFKECFKKFRELDNSTETGKCLTQELPFPTNSSNDNEQKLCWYSKTAADCLDKDTEVICESDEVKKSLVKSLNTTYAKSYCTPQDGDNPSGKVIPPTTAGVNFGQETSQTLTILTISIVSVMGMALE